MALPYITEETNFRGMILATEPTIHFGRIFMEETIEFIERAATSRKALRSGKIKTFKKATFFPARVQT